METVILVFAVILLVGGIIFSVLPPLPGPLMAFVGLLLTSVASEETQVSTWLLVTLGVIATVIQVADFVLPAAATKKYGGTKAGVIGGLIGTVIGAFSGIPFGIIIGPLLGAIIGDLVGGNHIRGAMKSGFASFIGFLLGTTVKIGYSIIVGVIVVWEIGGLFISWVSELF